MSEPTPTSELDEQLREIIRASQRGLRRVIRFLVAALTASMLVIAVLGYQQLTEHQRIDADVSEFVSGTCLFYVPLVDAGNQLTLKTGSKLGVQLVEGSREALHSLHCATSLYRVPPASAVLLQLGRKYGVPITY